MISIHVLLAAEMVLYFVGILVWSIGLSLGPPTGYAINPARDFGARLAYAVLPIDSKGIRNGITSGFRLWHLSLENFSEQWFWA